MVRYLALSLMLACGGTIGPNVGDDDYIGPDAGQDANQTADTSVADASLVCFDSSGDLDYSLKSCQSEADCVIEKHQVDCCGTILYVGVSASDAAQFGACEAAWTSTLPACGCASGQTKTEDGKVTYPNDDASAPAVHCTDFTMSGGVCLTYTP